jgi:hypothetical protein
MLIDEFLPRYDVVERHRIRVRATQAQTYAAIRSADLGSGALVKALLFLRMLPAALLGGVTAMRELAQTKRPAMTLRSIERGGFRVVAERAPAEIVIGVEGKFWTLDGGRCTPSAERFRTEPPEPGTARAVWDFRVSAFDGESCELTTETRVLCADAAVRRRFLPYWAIVRPGSGLIRQSMLRAIKTTAERTEAATPAATPA